MFPSESLTKLITYTIVILSFSTQLYAQDICEDAWDLGLLECSFNFAEVCGSGASTDPESEGCMVGQPGCWFTFEVSPEISAVEIYGDNYNLFENSCNSLFYLGDCSTTLFPVSSNTTYYLLIDNVFELIPVSPLNDDCSSALTLSSSGLSNQVMSCVSASSGSQCIGDLSVWYEYEVTEEKTYLTFTLSGLADAWGALYQDDCTSYVEPYENDCGSVLLYQCLDPGTYYFEVSSNQGGDIFDIEVDEDPNSFWDYHDDCINAMEIYNNPLECGKYSAIGAFEPGLGCPDTEQSADCFGENGGTWFYFDIGENVPWFEISGKYELFTGDCNSLNSLVYCEDNFRVFTTPGQRYLALVDPFEEIELVTPPAPINDNCSDAIVFDSEIFGTCCSEENWFVIPAMSEGVILEIIDPSATPHEISIYYENCDDQIFNGNSSSFPLQFNHCNEPLYLNVSKDPNGDCGEVEIIIENLDADYDYAYSCEGAQLIDQIITDLPPICLFSQNNFGCESTCTGNQSVWFEFETDELAKELHLIITGSGDFEPVFNIYSDCDDILFACVESENFSFDVNPSSTYFLQISSTDENDIFELCIRSSSAVSTICDHDTLDSAVLLDSLSFTYNNTDTVVSNIHKFDFSNCDSICLSMSVHTNGMAWIGTGNLEWYEECTTDTTLCNLDNPSAGPCSNCWDFLSASLVMNDSVFYHNVLGDEEFDPTFAIWSTGIIEVPEMSTDSGYVQMIGQTWAQNEELTYEGLTLICFTADLVDSDNDGVTSDLDCDDNDPNNYPGNIEICDGQDNNCDGVIDEGFSFDDPIITCESGVDFIAFNFDNLPQAICYNVSYSINGGNTTIEVVTDPSFIITGLSIMDIVTFSVEAKFTDACSTYSDAVSCITLNIIDNDGDGVSSEEDCDDNDPNNFPGNIEICDGQDNNCDGVADEGLSFLDYFADTDGDGFGDIDMHINDCSQPPGYVENSSDCDDSNPNINPNSIEVCDDLDNNCNQEIDEGLSFNNYYLDQDNDGFGDLESVINDCIMPMGYVIDSTDCNDLDPNINPGSIEIPNNNIDENCDGIIEIIDMDNDGFNSDEDCDDNNPNVFPGNTEVCDSIDNNCNQEIDEGLSFSNYYLDQDNDGFGDLANVIYDCMKPIGYVIDSTDCNDMDPNIFPGAEDIPSNGIDEDCDGMDATTSVHVVDGHEINIYPNPVTQILNIETSYTGYNYTLFSMDANVVMKGNVLDKEIDLTPLNSGVYILLIKSNSSAGFLIDRILKI